MKCMMDDGKAAADKMAKHDEPDKKYADFIARLYLTVIYIKFVFTLKKEFFPHCFLFDLTWNLLYEKSK